MKKIILCILLFASFIFALNCQLLTEEQKETMTREHFTEIPAIINSGITCQLQTSLKAGSLQIWYSRIHVW